MALRSSAARLASSPGMQIAPETTPVKYTPYMIGRINSRWFNRAPMPFDNDNFREREWWQTWPARRMGWEKSHGPVMTQRYSRAALQEATAMVPEWFEAKYVPRPPQRIRAQSEGIVGRWYSNYWTLHSVRYQCMLAGVPWRLGERERPVSNFDEPWQFVDFEESKAIRDERSRWINVNRSMAGMTRRMREVDEERRFVAHKALQEKFWSERRVLLNRVKAMRSSGIFNQDDLPAPHMHLRAFE